MNSRNFLFGCLIGSLLFLSNTLDAQNFVKKYYKNILDNSKDISKPKLLIYPTFAYAPETSWEIGFSSLYVFYANQDTINRLSQINGFTFFTLENQYGIWFDHAIYSHEDKWFFLGKLRFQSFPLFYHGIGMDTPAEHTAIIEAKQIILKERLLRKLKNNLFLGLGLDYQRLTKVDFVTTKSTDANFEDPIGSDGSNTIGIGLDLVQDNRHNVLNVREGFFSELSFLHYNPAWGSTFQFTSILSDTRYYKSLSKNKVLAAQLFGQFNEGNVPFNQLALLGGENIMRGYYLGRYRDNNQIATQIELRFLPLPFNFTNRIGAAVFAGTGSVFDEVSHYEFSNLVVSGGAGIRFLLFPKKDIWTRFDCAYTKEGMGYYLFIGESF